MIIHFFFTFFLKSRRQDCSITKDQHLDAGFTIERFAFGVYNEICTALERAL